MLYYNLLRDHNLSLRIKEKAAGKEFAPYLKLPPPSSVWLPTNKAAVRIITMYRWTKQENAFLESWTVLWSGSQRGGISLDISEMNSSRPPHIFLVGVDRSAPLLSVCETWRARWQLHQMFSHKAQMGRGDKHQLSAERRSWGGGNCQILTANVFFLTVTRRKTRITPAFTELP